MADHDDGTTPSGAHTNGHRPPSPDADALPVTAERPSRPISSRATTAPAPVTDEDRQRFGVLLDKAAERGLLTPADYEVRLRDLAAATTTDEMLAIVTDLPAFASVGGTTAPGSGRRRRSGLVTGPPSSDPAGLIRTPARGGRANPWLLLVLVLLVIVAVVALGLWVAHLHHPTAVGYPRTVPRGVVSVLRL